MDEKERDKQYRLWHFLDLLGVITWVMNRGIRGSAMVHKTPPRQTGEPPMVELDRLVKLAALGKAPDAVVDDEQMEQIVSLFHTVAFRDGSVSSEETAAMKKFIEGHLPPGSPEIEVEHFLIAFKDHHSSDANLKETCHLLRTRLRPGAAEQIVESLYRLAYFHGLDLEERCEVEKIGEYFGLFSSEIRLAESAARRSVEKKGD
ncbi:TerB family tellurite resistance protein [bacterium]|nr:TerB family tellurite resistance protein [bacterium]